MERRAPLSTLLAIVALCAILGLFATTNGLLLLAPFLLLLLPLAAGIDPAGPAVERLLGILGLGRGSGSGRPGVSYTHTNPVPDGRLPVARIRSRGPPRPLFS